jgi:cell wall-associated NlpC family hydrolase
MDATLEKEVDRLGRSSRVAAGITILGVIGVGLAMMYATSQLHSLQTEVAASRAQLKSVTEQREKAAAQVESLRKEIKNAEVEKQKYLEQISELKRQLSATTDLSRFVHPVDFVDWKGLASQNPAENRVLERILDLRRRRVGWLLGGTRPEEGFDSPSFAAYVLQSVLRGGQDRASSNLLSTLPPANEPRVGDLVFYPGGYALFFFLDHHNKPFVIGMTPQGIVALEPTFARIERVARPNYRR